MTSNDIKEKTSKVSKKHKKGYSARNRDLFAREDVVMGGDESSGMFWQSFSK